MRKILFAVAFIFISFSRVAWSIGKSTIDPNTLPRVEQKGFWEADDRLSQKVTLDARRWTVLSITSDLMKMTGVTLNSGYNAKDWQVRDRKMIVIAKDMPLKDLMQSIARAMKFKWSRSESEPYTYRIFMDRRTLLEEEGKAYRAEAKFEEQLIKRREVLADKMSKAADVSPAELEKMKSEDPYMYVLAKTGFTGPMAQFLQQVPTASEAFLNKSQARITGNQLSEEVMPAATLLAQAMDKLSQMGSSGTPEDDLDKPIEFQSIEFNIDDRNPSSPFMRQFYLGQIAMQWKQGNTTHSTSFPLMDSDTRMAKTAGLNYQMQLEKKPGDPDPKRIDSSFSGEEWSQLVKQSDFGEPVAIPSAEDWAIVCPVTITPNGHPKELVYTTAEEWMISLAKSTGMNIVSDYLGKSISREIGGGSNWWRHGNTLEFRNRYWFKKRSLQIPESYIEPWRAHFKENGTLEIDDLAQISALTGEQDKYEVNINGDEVLGNESMRQAINARSRKALPFYDSLSREQRAALLSNEGLSQDSLTPEQLEDLRSVVPYISNYTQPLKMTIKRSPSRNDYQFSVLSQSQMKLFSIWTPKYEPPKKEEQTKH